MSSPDYAALTKIAALLKSSLADLTSQDILALLDKHYIQLCLWRKTPNSENYTWTNERFEKIEALLRPTELTKSDIDQFIDSIAENVKYNNVLMNFLNMKFEVADYETVKGHLLQESKVHLPDVILYSFVLDRLNQAWLKDWKIFEACHEVWVNFNPIGAIIKKRDWFSMAKVLTLRKTFKLRIDQLRKQKVDPATGSIGMPLNIYEATEKESYKPSISIVLYRYLSCRTRSSGSSTTP